MQQRITFIIWGVLVVGVVLLFSSVFVVHQTNQALVLELGKPKRLIHQAGLRFKIPFIENVVFFDKRVLGYDGESQEIPTGDQKQVVVDAFAKYQIVNPLLFYQTARTEKAMRSRLDALTNSALRAVIGRVDLSVIMTDKRAELMKQVTHRVANNAKDFGVRVIDVRIKHIDLPSENSKAIFRRMQTQREQAAIKFRAEGESEARKIRADADKTSRIMLADARKKAQIIKGAGDAEAQKVYNQAFSKDRHFFEFWKSMDALKKSLNPGHTSIMMAPRGELFKYFLGGNSAK